MKTAYINHFSRKLKFYLQHTIISAFLAFALIFFSGCATVGHDFPTDQVRKIQIGQTSKEDIRAMFGEPWRVGLEDGLETWSYGQYKYRMFSEKDAKDLVVRFGDNDMVESYTYNATTP